MDMRYQDRIHNRLANYGKARYDATAIAAEADAEIKALRAALQEYPYLDCRTCANFVGRNWPGHCHATMRCVDGSSYKATVPIQLWE